MNILSKTTVEFSDTASYEHNGEIKSAFQRNEVVERRMKKIGMAEYAFRRIIGHKHRFNTEEITFRVMRKEQYENFSSR